MLSGRVFDEVLGVEIFEGSVGKYFSFSIVIRVRDGSDATLRFYLAALTLRTEPANLPSILHAHESVTVRLSNACENRTTESSI